MFSIVIVVKAINDYLRAALPWIQKQTCQDFEIIIVSECAENETFAKTRILTVGRVNPAQARNIGVQAARGEIIAFIDDDAYPAPDWLEKARQTLQDPTVGVVGGPSLVPAEATFFQRVSSKVYELSSAKTGPRYGRRRKAAIDDWPTCNFFVRKSIFDAVGGFDIKYWGGEDTQLCYSFVKAGVKMLYDPEVIIYHHPRKTLRQHLKQTFFWGMWRGYLVKHYQQSRQMVFFVPGLFLLWLVGGALLSAVWAPVRIVYLSTLALYLLYLMIIAVRTQNPGLALPVAAVTCLSQLAYGIGFWRGLVSRKGPTTQTLNPIPTPRAGSTRPAEAPANSLTN